MNVSVAIETYTQKAYECVQEYNEICRVLGEAVPQVETAEAEAEIPQSTDADFQSAEVDAETSEERARSAAPE